MVAVNQKRLNGLMLVGLRFTDGLGHATEMNEETFLPLSEAMDCYEGQHLCHALERACGNRTEAARLLNISRRTFYRKLAKYNL